MGKSLRRNLLHKNLDKYKDKIEKIKNEQKNNNKEKNNNQKNSKSIKSDREEKKQTDKKHENVKVHEKSKLQKDRPRTEIYKHVSLKPKIQNYKDIPRTENDKHREETRDIYIENTTQRQKNEQDGGASYLSIARSNYKKPRGPSKQDQLTLEQIRTKLQGHRELKTIREKAILQYLQPFRVWVRYYDTKKEKFRVGGLLMKVDYPNYATLVNTKNNISWSIQLNDNIIYIPETAVESAKKRAREQMREKTIPKTPEMTEKTENTDTSTREDLIKEKLYDLFLKGKLKVLTT